MRQILVFIDGVGLGPEQEQNPFYSFATPGFSTILEGNRLVASAAGFHGQTATLVGLDATLGVSGLPQSATGQASIFTGINAPLYLGRHLNGFPGRKLRGLLALKGFFNRFQLSGYRVCFVNAYRPRFFDLLDRGLPGNFYSCSTLLTYFGGLKFMSLEDLLAGRALYMDITNQLLCSQGFAIPVIEPEEGALKLLSISRQYDFSLFEFFLSDLAGHSGAEGQAGQVIETLDRFVGTLASNVDQEDTFILLCSDHGNLEDASINDHTFNPVPLLMIGNPELRLALAKDARDLADMPALIEQGLSWKGSADDH